MDRAGDRGMDGAADRGGDRRGGRGVGRRQRHEEPGAGVASGERTGPQEWGAGRGATSVEGEGTGLELRRPGTGPGGVRRSGPGWGGQGRGGPGCGGPGRGGPLIVTEDPDLLDDLLRLCAAAGVRPEVHHGLPEERGAWEAAPLVLLGHDAVVRVSGAARREGVLLVARATGEAEEAGIWRRAVEIGAENVLRLPETEEWLTDRIADVAEGAAGPALSIGVIGGRGGAGASTLACALAVTAAAQSRRTMLVDADPLGGGLDVLLGGETAEGLRWPAFARSRGRVGAGALEESLPELHALRVLSWDRGVPAGVPPEAVRAVLAAARRRGGIVLVDLPRRFDEDVEEVLAQLDLVLLLVPKELRALAAAGRVAATVATTLHDVRVVVGPGTGPAAQGLDATAVARLLDLPLVGEVPWERGLMEAQVAGRPPGSVPKGPLAGFCRDFWAEVLPPGSGAADPWPPVAVPGARKGGGGVAAGPDGGWTVGFDAGAVVGSDAVTDAVSGGGPGDGSRGGLGGEPVDRVGDGRPVDRVGDGRPVGRFAGLVSGSGEWVSPWGLGSGARVLGRSGARRRAGAWPAGSRPARGPVGVGTGGAGGEDV